MNWFLLALKQLFLMETKSDICSFYKSRTVLEFRLTWDRKTCQTWLRLPFLLQTPSWSPSWPGQNSWAGSGHMDLQPPASGEENTRGEMLDCWTLSFFQSDTWCNLIGTKHCADLKVAKLVAEHIVHSDLSPALFTCTQQRDYWQNVVVWRSDWWSFFTRIQRISLSLWWSWKYAQLIAWSYQTFCFHGWY